jgi:hypothetical protein
MRASPGKAQRKENKSFFTGLRLPELRVILFFSRIRYHIRARAGKE